MEDFRAAETDCTQAQSRNRHSLSLKAEVFHRDWTDWLTTQSVANQSLRFPANREINREIYKTGPFAALAMLKSADALGTFDAIPWIIEQGISGEKTGKSFSEFCPDPHDQTFAGYLPT
jgi:hypothetical protein